MAIVNCKMCKTGFDYYPATVILCKHHEGVVHLGCCINECSGDKKPCEHSQGMFEKL